jgi:hypothetical protein
MERFRGALLGAWGQTALIKLDLARDKSPAINRRF